MPVYEFSCADCGARMDVRASINELEVGLEPACDACGSPRTRRLLSTFATRSSGVPAAAGVPAGGCGGGCDCACS